MAWTRVSIGAGPQTRRCARRVEWCGRAGAVATGLSPRNVRLATGSLRWSFFTLGRLLALTSRQYSMIRAPRARRGARAGPGRERDCEHRAQTPTKLCGSRAKGELSSSRRLREVPTPGRGLREDTGHSPGGPSPRRGGGRGRGQTPAARSAGLSVGPARSPNDSAADSGCKALPGSGDTAPAGPARGSPQRRRLPAGPGLPSISMQFPRCRASAGLLPAAPSPACRPRTLG